MQIAGKDICYLKEERREGGYIKEKGNGKILYGYVYGKNFEDVKDQLSNISQSDIDHPDNERLFKSAATDW